MVFISSGTPWIDRLAAGSFSLVGGIYLWMTPGYAANSVCGFGVAVTGIAFLVDGLWTGRALGWALGEEPGGNDPRAARGGNVADAELVREMRARQGDESQEEEKDY